MVFGRQQTMCALVLTLLAAALALGGCGTDGVHYATNKEHGFFLKVPHDWIRVELLTPTRPEALTTEIWRVFFDKNPEYSVEHLQDARAPVPSAMVEIIPLELTEVRDDISLSWMRSIQVDINDTAGALLDRLEEDAEAEEAVISEPQTADEAETELEPIRIDPLRAFSVGVTTVELVEYSELTSEGGYWGAHVVVNLAQEDGSYRTMAQRMMVDQGINTLFILRVACSSICFDDHQPEIDRIFDSWTIKKP